MTEQCKYCKHYKNDHHQNRIIENGKIVKEWRGSCDWVDCICEIYEFDEKEPKLYIIKKHDGSLKVSNRKIFVCKNCKRGFTKSKSLSSHVGHCQGVMKRMKEKSKHSEVVFS